MTNTTGSTVWTDRSWQIVRADLDLAHVFLPLSNFSFKATSRNGMDGYTIVHNGQSPVPDCFCDSFLTLIGSHKPTFEAITKKSTLPLFTKDSAAEYAEVSDAMAQYTEKNREIQRLEGVVRIPCHAHGASLHKDAATDHSPMWIKTLLHVYQFGNVVKGDRPLLVLRAPLSPVCPLNGDGGAIGYP